MRLYVVLLLDLLMKEQNEQQIYLANAITSRPGMHLSLPAVTDANEIQMS